MILDILFDSFKFSISKPKVFVKLALLNLLSLLIVPIVFVEGYSFRVTMQSTRGMINSDEQLPEFDNLRGMFIDGIKVTVAEVSYLIIFLIVAIILLTLSYLLGFSDWVADLIIYILLFIVWGYSCIAIANMAFHNSFRKAFSFHEINNIIRNKIGILPLIILLAILDALRFVLDHFIIKFGDKITGLINFSNYSDIISVILYGILVSLLIQPLISLMVARATGILYVSDD